MHNLTESNGANRGQWEAIRHGSGPLLVLAGPGSGKTFVITGTLSHPRDYFEQLIASHGGKATGAISKSTSFLLAGSGGGSKRDKALKLGVPVISEEDFYKMIGN